MKSRPCLRLVLHRLPSAGLAALGLIAGWVTSGCAEPASRDLPRPESPGGRLVATLTAEPRTFNPTVATDNPSLTVLGPLHADLIHTNPLSFENVPALARGWSVSEDGRRFTLELRRDVRFSDGHPLDADDVLFTFQVILDPEVGSPNRSLLILDGEPPVLRKLDEHRIELELPRPYAVGVKLFDSIAVLPEHRLGDAWRAGRFADTWGLATPAEEIVGLGPFRLKSFLPGERLVLERNPHYWKLDAEGRRLPRLDELVFLFVPDREARLVRFRSGEAQVVERLSASGYSLLESQNSGAWRLQDLGPGSDFHFLFFNLNDLEAGLHPELEAKQAWFRQTAFRRALSRAIDREAIVRLVYAGRATALASHITAGNAPWHHPGLPSPRHDPDAARQLLAEAGFTWDRDGQLHDAGGRRVELSLMTNASNDERVRMAQIVQEDLRQIGLEVRLATLEFQALVRRLRDADYEACLLGLAGAWDPNQFIPLWRSDGANHLWHLQRQKPKTPWQAEIDELLDQQIRVDNTAERKRLYDRVQEILAEQEPVLLLVSPHQLVGADARLGNFRPAIFGHPTLWNVDELFWRTR